MEIEGAFFGLAPNKLKCLDVPQLAYGAKSKIAPKVVGKPFTFETYYGRYAYLTEIAEVDDEICGEDLYKLRAYKTLCRKIRGIGLSDTDLHGANVGYYKGKLVCIDFGPESHLDDSECECELIYGCRFSR